MQLVQRPHADKHRQQLLRRCPSEGVWSLGAVSVGVVTEFDIHDSHKHPTIQIDGTPTF